MTKKKNSSNLAKSKTSVGLVFGEDANDAEALKHLVSSLWPRAPRMEYSRKPLILIKDQKKAEDRKKNAQSVASVVKAFQVRFDVNLVIAHSDCDAVEPAHVPLSQTVKAELESQGIQSVAVATPAWEMEAWWYLWPTAVARVNSKWRRLKRTGNHGYIQNAKEQLRRDLRTERARDYEESDAPRIASMVKEMGLINNRVGISGSFSAFEAEIRAIQTR